jgi:AcrR family transcriptional regulator
VTAPRGPRRAPARTRRRSESQLDTPRERIHAAALRLFARYGYDGTSLQMIADAVGLHKSSLYHHYRGKLEVASEAFESALAQVAALMQPLVEEESPSLACLVEVCGVLSDHFCEHPDVARLAMWIMTAASDSDLHLHVGSEGEHRVPTVLAILAGWLDRAKRAGVIRPANLRQTIFNLIGMMLFYPAAAARGDVFSGDDPFSAKPRRIRRDELRGAVVGMLEPR